LREIGGIGKRLANVLIFKIREVAEQVLDGSARRKGFDDHADRDAHPPDTWLSAHNFRTGGYPAELLHVVRIAFPLSNPPEIVAITDEASGEDSILNSQEYTDSFAKKGKIAAFFEWAVFFVFSGVAGSLRRF
jgi:hypothetical protein